MNPLDDPIVAFWKKAADIARHPNNVRKAEAAMMARIREIQNG